MKYTKVQLRDIVQWDVTNWAKSIYYWDANINFDNISSCLEIGACRGGLSLWLAMHGKKDIICSDYNDNRSIAFQLHNKYGFDFIQYKVINATNIGIQNKFDIICFKSVLGGIGYNDNKQDQEKAISEMYNALKPGGLLIFAENLRGSKMHIFLREKFVKWGNKWRYVTIDELIKMTSLFSSIQYKTYGFLGLLGRKEWQRNFLGRIDTLICPFVPEKRKYIGIFICKK